jgi:hypothetical protein
VDSLSALDALGRTIAVALAVVGLAAGGAGVVCLLLCAAPRLWAGPRRRRTQRRYVQTGLRDIERFLAGAPDHGARGGSRRRPRPPHRPRDGERGQDRHGGRDR